VILFWILRCLFGRVPLGVLVSNIFLSEFGDVSRR
jgi:hypothetical protein